MAERLFKLEIISPDKIFYSNDVYMVEYTTTEGDVGVYAGHIPMTQILAPGVLTISEDENTQRTAALHAGFVEISQEKVTILAETAEWPEEIDVNRAKEAAIRAKRRIEAGGDMDMKRAELALKRALIRESVARM
ncbi:MAG: ATP synthase F1 subunit epsilon [Eubacterium sp.]|nr:ATP synthase F1 subunit epsilon [Eubacterium sp.]